MKLVHEDTRKEVHVGDEVTDFRGEVCIIIAICEPYKPASTGMVYVEEKETGHTRENSPSVFDLVWKGRTDQ